MSESAASGYEFSFQVFEVTAEEAEALFDAAASFVHERADQVFGIGPGPIKDEGGTSPVSDAATMFVVTTTETATTQYTVFASSYDEAKEKVERGEYDGSGATSATTTWRSLPNHGGTG